MAGVLGLAVGERNGAAWTWRSQQGEKNSKGGADDAGGREFLLVGGNVFRCVIENDPGAAAFQFT